MSMKSGESAASVFFELLGRSDFAEGLCWQQLHFKQGDIILREGSYSGKVFLLLQGEARILGKVVLGEDLQIRPGVRDLDSGSIFGELSLLDQAPHSATVSALTDCVVAAMDNEALIAFLNDHREFGYKAYRELALELVSRLRKTDKQLFAMMAYGLKARGLDQHLKA